MKPLLVKHCFSNQPIIRVLEEERPEKINPGTIYAVFKNSIENGTFCGLVTHYDVALHPGWIFADLCEHRPLFFVTPESEISDATQIMEQEHLEVLAVLGQASVFLGVISKNSILESLLKREHKLLEHTTVLKNKLESEHAEVLAWSKKLSELHTASRTLLGVLAHTSLEVDLLQTGIEALTNLLQARYGAIGILDDDGSLKTFVHTGLSQKQITDIGRLPEGKGLLGVVIGENVSLLLNDIGNDPRSCGFPPNHPVMKTLLAVPISYNNYVHGRIYLSDKISGEPFTKDDEHLAKSFAQSLSLVIDNARKIAEIKQAQHHLEYMAHHDALTGLPNRILLTDRFHQALAHSKRSKNQLAVCFLDLDNFKLVNDRYGHKIGDKLLVEMANRISRTIREEDTVSRLGGDEFVILIASIHSIVHCEETLKRIHHALNEPCLIDGHLHKITASSGVTVYPLDNADMDTLMRHADQAMYQAKLSGRNKYHFFNTEYEQQIEQKHHQLSVIQQALSNDELCLYYQPKITMSSGEVFGAEALIRWRHPEKGLLPPKEFLPVIEGTDLEIQIGNWVIEQSLKQAYQWQQQGILIEISINVSSHHLLSDNFSEQLGKALSAYPTLNLSYIQLEILESSELSDLESIRSIIKSCHDKLGVNFALDDFGTSYSSLTHLRSLSIETIKIDQSFVRGLLDNPNDFAITEGIIALSDSLDRKVIAEGVETTEHGLILQLMGCDKAQGYAIAKPMSTDRFLEWLEHYTPNSAWINNKHKKHAIKTKKLEIFRLVSEQWQKKVLAHIHSHPESNNSWPFKNYESSHCAIWIKQVRQECLFEEEWLTQLEKAHNKLYRIAENLLLNYQTGKLDDARKGIKKLEAAFESMHSVLNNMAVLA